MEYFFLALLGFILLLPVQGLTKATKSHFQPCFVPALAMTWGGLLNCVLASLIVWRIIPQVSWLMTLALALVIGVLVGWVASRAYDYGDARHHQAELARAQTRALRARER